MRVVLAVFLVALAVSFVYLGWRVSPAFFVQYDNDVGECVVSDGNYRIRIYAKRDSTTTDDDAPPQEFLAACEIIGAGEISP